MCFINSILSTSSGRDRLDVFYHRLKAVRMLPKNRTAHIHLANRIAERRWKQEHVLLIEESITIPQFTAVFFDRLTQPALTLPEMCARLNS